MIDYNELTGSIPTEVGLLTELTSLGLCKRLFSVLLVCFEIKQIHSFFASNLFSLIFSHIILIASNELTGSIPTEVGLLTELVGSLSLCKRLFSVSLVCFETNQIHSFFASNLFSLIFSHIILTDINELTGSIPTEVGLLTELTRLRLGKHFISI